jgi:hypothetical protein
MGWLAGILKIKWVPWAAAGLVAYSAVLGGYSYMKGKHNTELKYQEAITDGLKVQMKVNQKIAAGDMKVVTKTAVAEEKMNHAIDDLELPEIPAECTAAFHSWMLSFNDAVRIANGDAPATD